jgi:hypothetical protein
MLVLSGISRKTRIATNIRKYPPNGRILWEGKSELNGDPIVAIATGFVRKTKNPKTGDMMQVWILHQNVHPHEATQTGDDTAVCGDCPLKPLNLSLCYVRTGDAPNKVWDAFQRGIYPYATEKDMIKLRSKSVRLGAYGDPAAVPYEAVLTWLGKSWTGYTHQWKSCDQRFKSIVMASADFPQDRDLALKMGWKYFTGVDSYDNLPENTIICHNDTKSKRTCEDCGLCSGNMSPLKKNGIAIKLHGWKVTSKSVKRLLAA